MKQRQKKKPLADSVCTSNKRLREDRTCQSPPSIIILPHRGKPTESRREQITVNWGNTEPTPAFVFLMRRLLSPQNKARGEGRDD